MSAGNRRQRRAAAKVRLDGGDPIDRLPPSRFRDQMQELAALGGFANHVSMEQTGLPTTTAGSLASMVYAKCCAHARSIGAIAIGSSMFDHHAIMTLARMIVEAWTMLAYLEERISSDEWALRYAILKLHDTCTRIKLLRSVAGGTIDLREGREGLKAELLDMELFAALRADRQTRVLSGEEMYVTGMRSVATGAAGWREEEFMAVYAYLSAHAHSAPVSFMRMKDHGIDYFFPSETQREILVLPMEAAIACLRRAMLSRIDREPHQLDAYHPELLAEAREKDAASPFFQLAPADV